jgi:hypothetical protein
MLERWIALSYSPSVANRIKDQVRNPHLSIPAAGIRMVSCLRTSRTFFKLQRNLHHFIVIASYPDLAMTDG